MDKIKIFQISIGIIMIIFGIYAMNESLDIQLSHPYISGMLFGEYAVIILWGVRELMGGIAKIGKSNNK